MYVFVMQTNEYIRHESLQHKYLFVYHNYLKERNISGAKV